jgi:ABC-type sugar transport system substrate-binding protein
LAAALLLCGFAVAFAGGGRGEKTGPIVIGVSMDTVDHPFWRRTSPA